MRQRNFKICQKEIQKNSAVSSTVCQFLLKPPPEVCGRMVCTLRFNIFCSSNCIWFQLRGTFEMSYEDTDYPPWLVQGNASDLLLPPDLLDFTVRIFVVELHKFAFRGWQQSFGIFFHLRTAWSILPLFLASHFGSPCSFNRTVRI